MSLIDLDYYENKSDDLSKNKDVLKELPLYNFYENIDKKLNNNEATDNCTECNTKLSGTEEDVLELHKLCKSFCNIILKDNDLNLHCSNPPCNTSCSYMYLWLYNKVINITEKPSLIKKFYTALQTISETTRSDKKFCYIRRFDANREKFKNFKHLYEFLFTYYDINKKLSPQRNREDRIYCNHIKENFRFYNYIKENCPQLDKCSYKNELQQIKENVSKHINLSEICNKCNYEQTQCKTDSKETNDIPCLKENGSTLTLPITNPDQYNAVNQVSKFTPLGSWLYSKIKRTNNIEKNINAENYYISHHNTRIEEIDPVNSSNNAY
ncbi:hypothetical protein PVIIG_06250 [Plasmodium vivax India VII]|uniref:Uncharacterized protein n=1 Tax=Plasmodium vivax India VII TaxID=1077284 RepID=A0A0J9S1K3_PLAVI|nr:hypothetical protein PVIIG_06250 [Plasmodium vivax India VII]